MDLREAKEFLNDKGYELIDEGLMDRVKDTFGLNNNDKIYKFEANTAKVIAKVIEDRKKSWDDIKSSRATDANSNTIKLRYKTNDDEDGWIYIFFSPFKTAGFGKEQTDEQIEKAIKYVANKIDANVSEVEDRYYTIKDKAAKEKLVPVVVKYADITGKKYWKILYPYENALNDYLDKLNTSFRKEFEYEIKNEDALAWNKKHFYI